MFFIHSGNNDYYKSSPFTPAVLLSGGPLLHQELCEKDSKEDEMVTAGERPWLPIATHRRDQLRKSNDPVCRRNVQYLDMSCTCMNIQNHVYIHTRRTGTKRR